MVKMGAQSTGKVAGKMLEGVVSQWCSIVKKKTSGLKNVHYKKLLYGGVIFYPILPNFTHFNRLSTP